MRWSDDHLFFILTRTPALEILMRRLGILLVLFARILASAQANEPHTRVRLVADVATLRPGSTFSAGVVLSMDPGWHTYWKNSGEAGLPTSIRWRLPAGVTAGEIQWPLPNKYVESGDVLTYGYKDETMLLVPIRVEPSVNPGSTVTLRAEVSWLECEAICVPGEADEKLTLRVEDRQPAPASTELFGRYRATLPESLAEARDLDVRIERARGEIRLIVQGRGTPLEFSPESSPDFYPEPQEDISIGRTRVRTDRDRAELSFSLTAYQRLTEAQTIAGILVMPSGENERRGYRIEIDLPAEYVRTIPLPGEEPSSGGLLEMDFSAERAGANTSLALYLVFALIGGILLNIMPCVLPVIALKVFGIVKMAGDEPRRVKRLGWMFSLGILASFLVLALVVILLQLAGQQVGWGFQFQEPLFVIAMSAIVFAFGLSLFGVFEVQLPGSAVAGVSALASRQEGAGKGYTASFFEGVFATILATPCTAPFLGSALGFAFAQPAGVILLIFSTVALGMALPYLVLTMQPNWLKYVPKPGEWMVTVKQFMGFLMMATLLWLLYVLGKQLGMEAVIWTGAFLLSVGIACWLIGRFATLSASRRRSLATWASAVVIVALGYFVFLESILDVQDVIAGQGAAGSSDGIQWEPFSLESLEGKLKGDRPVFVDFTAEWCLTCKVNERTVLADHEVIQRFRDLDIVAVKADWTNRNPDITRLLAKFGRSGVPLYVVFPPGRPEDAIILPEVITEGIVLEALDRASGRAA
jgi:thiol:disulfide interchange protein/DsbC/DsbD-like thiol-disulfide interchange protein